MNIRRDGDTPLLEIHSLGVEFNVGRNRPPLRAVDDVNLSVAAGETVGLVGESGSGKSSIGRAVAGLVPVTRGTVKFDGTDITNANYSQRRALSAYIQVVFQDPYSSLNPTRTIGQTLLETLRVHEKLEPEALRARASAMLERVGLSAAALERYPAQFSGGQRQRIAIARALITQPRLVICDEPVSALDLSVQAQVLNLLKELQTEFSLGYLFIAHDLAVVRHLSHRIVVLFRGQVMEEGTASDVYERPSHPYTRALLAAAPVPDPELQQARRRAWVGRPVDIAAPQSAGCPFASRCPWVIEFCRSQRPRLEPTPEGSAVACHRWLDVRQDRQLNPDVVADVASTQSRGPSI